MSAAAITKIATITKNKRYYKTETHNNSNKYKKATHIVQRNINIIDKLTN